MSTLRIRRNNQELFLIRKNLKYGMGIILAFLSCRKTQKKMIPYIITLTVLVIWYLLPQDDLITFLILVVLILVFCICRFDSRIPIIFAILLLLIGGVLTSQQKDVVANRLAVQSYSLLIVGIVSIITELYRKTICNDDVIVQ
jgi:hypothetical protein